MPATLATFNENGDIWQRKTKKTDSNQTGDIGNRRPTTVFENSDI